MNKNNIKFKYLLGLWKTMPQYPTKEDIIYEISLYLVKDKRPNGDFSEQTFNSIFGKNWRNEKSGEIISEMLQNDDITETKKSTVAKKWYTIKNNPYYN